MKVCFFHQVFDIDVSSGTDHALYQWFELFHGFNVTECAIINETTDTLPNIDSNIAVHEFNVLGDFLAQISGTKTYVEKGGPDFKQFDFSETDWLIFGGTHGLPKADVGINTGTTSLYPRQACAVILGAL